MKKLFLGLLMACALMACNQANKATTTTTTVTTAKIDTANAPVIKFDNESFDFGKIKTGDKVSYSFKFTNTGKSPLIISDATASCGCTTPQWPHTPVLPGGKGEIAVVFNSAGKSGLQDKQITVTANTVPAQSMVHLIGEVLTKK